MHVLASGKSPSPQGARPLAPGTGASARERAPDPSRGHSLARLTVGPPPPAAPLQAAGVLDAARGAKAKLGRGYESVKGFGKSLNKKPGFQKFRAVLGMLGIAGGYQQGYGSPGDEGRGAEARGAFRGKWEKYLAGLPPEKQAAARLKYSLPEVDAQPHGGPAPQSGPQPQPEPRPQSGPQEVEMQDFSSNRSPVGGIAPPRNRFDEHAEAD